MKDEKPLADTLYDLFRKEELYDLKKEYSLRIRSINKKEDPKRYSKLKRMLSRVVAAINNKS